MSDKLKKKIINSIRAFKIPLIYLILSTLWIFFSDEFVEKLSTNPAELTKLQTIKGWLFVIASTLVLYFLIKKDRNKIEEALEDEKSARERADLMKQQILDEQEKTRMIIEYASEGIFIADENGYYIDVNPVGCKMLGYTKEEILKKNLRDLIFYDEHAPKLALDKLQKGETVTVERKLIRKDGSILEAEIVAKMLPDKRFQGLVRDISQRKKAENILKQSEERFKAFFNSDVLGTFYGDINGNVFSANNEFLRILGLTTEDVEREKIRIQNFTPPEFYQLDIINLENAKHLGSSQPYEKQFIRKNGERIWVLMGFVIVGPKKDEILAYVLDLTKLKEAEENYKRLYIENEELLQRLQLHLERIPLAYLIIDKNFKVKFFNPEAEKIFGFKNSEIKGKDPYEFLIPESSKPLVEEKRKRWLLGDLNANGINENLTKDGRIILCEWYNTPILDENGELVEVISMGFDVTEREKSKTELQRSEQKLRALASHLQSVREEERAAIARELHDELGQILTSIKMNLIMMSKQVMQEDESFDKKIFENEIHSMNEMIEHSVKRLKKLISELRPEVLESLGLIPALEWLITQFTSRTGIKIKFNKEVENPELTKVQELFIYRIVQESLTNALRHSGASEILIDINKNEHLLEIKISDNGKGFNPDSLEPLQSIGITGMKERALAFGADLDIKSKSGSGTSVLLKVPITNNLNEGLK
ncbi:MAG: PAS domain S-box protein [Ignavibacterium album]|mgnify:CR=1 FL=1|jgi:PAS domain S-box-containing protein|uniref:PAS domain S-box protein n=1 Tax=Ignavibacterium album TaxID=591197 RepID=A0A7V3E5W4_9BACT|nr:PAS domain S-box protein [Ignavibacterium album]MCX8104970.1 PAS domain S-box protein [Ignavibacterium album]